MTSARALTGSLREGFAGIMRRGLRSASRRGFHVQLPVVRLRDYYDAASLEANVVAPYRMTSPPRLPGAIVGCGVWRGGSVLAAALTLLGLGAGDRPLWLYDTVDGMTEPTEHARTADARDAQGWIAKKIGYPRELVRYVAGPVDDHGYRLGARRAVGEYFREDPVLLVRVDTFAPLVIKPHDSQPGRKP